MKAKASKLDAYAERLQEWFLGGKTLKEAQEELRLDGCAVSVGRLSEWWQSRQAALEAKQLLKDIASGAQQCREVSAQLADHPAPEVELLIQLHRVLIMKISTQANARPELLETVNQMMKPVLDFAKLQEKRAERELAEQKYRDQVAERKRAIEAELGKARTGGGLTPETLERIERELKLL